MIELAERNGRGGAEMSENYNEKNPYLHSVGFAMKSTQNVEI